MDAHPPERWAVAAQRASGLVLLVAVTAPLALTRVRSDPADATVKIFVSGDTMYFGFDVNDGYVQHVAAFDRWDGFLVNFNDRGAIAADHQLLGRRLSFQVGADGSAAPGFQMPLMG